MVLVLLRNLTLKDKSNAVEHLIKASTPSQDFFFLIILSIITATFGLLLNNIAVIIGSMLIAPMLYPLLSLSLGVVLSDNRLISRSFYAVVKSVIFGILASATTTILFSSHFDQVTSEIASRTHATLPYVIIAIVAGLAGSFALVKPHLSETLPGIAISVAMVPPLAVVGIGLAKLDIAIISGSFLTFLVNAAGVVFAGVLMFSLMNFYVEKSDAKKSVAKEDAKVEREIKMVENNKN